MLRFVSRIVAASLLLIAGSASAQVVVSQVYGAGGNSGATLRSDFIELHNNGTTAVNLSTWSVQYASSTGTTWSRTNLTGSIAAGGYFLVKQADGTGGTVSLPTPDTTGTIAMSGTAGKIALVNNQTSLTGSCPLGGAVVDFVGYGTGTNCSETAPTASTTARRFARATAAPIPATTAPTSPSPPPIRAIPHRRSPFAARARLCWRSTTSARSKATAAPPR
jgi:uncharacterized protein